MNKNERAFPLCNMTPMTQRVFHEGMTLRDYFAAAALSGQLTCIGNQADPEKRAVEAYRFADAMLKERDK